MTDKLKPCPFCGADVLSDHAIWPDAGVNKSAVRCSCGARGPMVANADRATSAWNNRTPSDRDKAEMMLLGMQGDGYGFYQHAEKCRAEVNEYVQAIATVLSRMTPEEVARLNAEIDGDPTLDKPPHEGAE